MSAGNQPCRFVRRAFGRDTASESLTSAATSHLALEPQNYVIVLSGFPPLNERTIPGGLDRAFLDNTKLVVKGQEPRPSDVDLRRGVGRLM